MLYEVIRVSNRIPEITDELYKIDDAMKAGFGWEHGPFRITSYNVCYTKLLRMC